MSCAKVFRAVNGIDKEYLSYFTSYIYLFTRPFANTLINDLRNFQTKTYSMQLFTRPFTF